MQVPTEGVYRAQAFVHDESPRGPVQIEVVARWGDELLSITHLRPGERFALTPCDPPLVTHTADGALLTPPAGASGHLRTGTASAPIEGATRLHRATFALVRIGDVSVSVRAVSEEPAMPRARRLTAFHAMIALLLTLAVSAGLWARDATEHPPEIAVDDGAARQWLLSHLRPSNAPFTARKPERWPVVYRTLCGCGEPSPNDNEPFTAAYESELHNDLRRRGYLIGQISGPLRYHAVETLLWRERERLLAQSHLSIAELSDGVWIDLRIRQRHGVPIIASMSRVRTNPETGYEPLFRAYLPRATFAQQDTLVRVVLGQRAWYEDTNPLTARFAPLTLRAPTARRDGRRLKRPA